MDPLHIGHSIALDLDRLATCDDVAHVVVFEREPQGWDESQVLEVPAWLQGSGFGRSLALDGDRLLVGAHKAGVHGRAYLFERIADAWVETTTFAPPVELDGFDGFGRSVSLAGDLVAIAYPGCEVDGELLTGSVFVYRDGAGGWELDVRVLPPVVGIGYGFGCEMAFAGENLITSYSQPSGLMVLAVSEAVELACACDGSAPCGNEFGAAGCRVLAHEGARLASCGSASLAADDLVLEVSRIPANQSGLVFLAQPGPALPFGDGLLCVAPSGPGPFRYPLQTSDSGGSLELGPGIGEYAHDHFPTTGWMLPGSTWSFQGWFRAPAGPCGTGFGLTNALLVTFGA